jgi:methylated-DNA-[protein]-cysteine S-methyltransferase
VESPVGPLTLLADEDALLALRFGDLPTTPGAERSRAADARLAPAAAQLREYFAGVRRDFDLRLKPTGTAFQLAVWAALRQIPYGETISYAELARRIGNPKAVRAVGLANGANPIAIVVPCHRVIGADGRLVGYGGGLEIKERLLALEGARPACAAPRGARLWP